jgi:hypothetical protein
MCSERNPIIRTAFWNEEVPDRGSPALITPSKVRIEGAIPWPGCEFLKGVN